MRMVAGLLAISAALAQSPDLLTLADAERIALRNHPAIRAAQFTAQAAAQTAIAARAPLYPQLSGNLTGAGAPENTRLAAGALNNPIILSRFASGFTVNQTITDFGKTGNLVESAKLHAAAQDRNTGTARAAVLLQVRRAYYAALSAQAVVRVTAQTVEARQLVADQVNALAENKLKSGLDVSFAEVALAEARLLAASAVNEQRAAMAELSAALGYGEPRDFRLDEKIPSPDLPADPKELLREARSARPELAALRLEHSAALRSAKAERAALLPSVGMIASVGVAPGHTEALRGRYGALGVNLTIPILNGGLYQARRAEAEYRAQSLEQSANDLENRIARDVQVAWLNANTARDRLSLTAQLLDRAAQALDLAQTRYDLGLSSIVELSQAQLAKTSAEIGSARARYEYLTAVAGLRYAAGAAD
jgi:outer membrane protein